MLDVRWLRYRIRYLKDKRAQVSLLSKSWLKIHSLNADIAEIGVLLNPCYKLPVPLGNKDGIDKYKVWVNKQIKWTVRNITSLIAS